MPRNDRILSLGDYLTACFSALILVISAGCADAPPEPAPVAEKPTAESPADDSLEGVGLLGNELRRPDLDEAYRAEHEGLLAEAEDRLKTAPGDVDAWIWRGRRTAYLGEYGEAVKIYSEALELPGLGSQDRARLLRHRGHRQLSLRLLQEAAADFEEAARLVADLPDRVEEDGLPNARNQPTSTLGTNIYYHLGLVRYLQGNFESALAAYEKCWELSKNPDMQVATAYWLHMTLARLGRTEEAAAVLGPITAELDIIENQAYHRLLLAFRGELQLEALLEEAGAAGGAALATTGYGVGFGYEARGDEAAAAEVWRRVVESGAWASFGFIAAEAELPRLRD